MCLKPRLIDNPYYNSPIRDPDYHILHNTQDTKLAVPCGHCSVCCHLRQVYLVQRVQMQGLSHDLYYGTLTYNDEMIRRAKYGDIEFLYPDFTDWQKMIKMIRKHEDLPKFSYLIVSEYGTKKHRPHFHFLLSFPKLDIDAQRWSFEKKLFRIFLKYWRRNLGSTRAPIWKDLCTYRYTRSRHNYELHWLNPYSSEKGLDSVAFYVTKYILKYDPWVDKFTSKLFFNLDESDFKEARKLLRPRILISKGFGSAHDLNVQLHINRGIAKALAHPQAMFPFYISNVDGSTYPLAPYYQKKLLKVSDLLEFRKRIPEFKEDIDPEDLYKKDVDFLARKSYLYHQLSLFDFDMESDINIDNLENEWYEKKPPRFSADDLSVDPSFL